jgi:hypothetical protein
MVSPQKSFAAPSIVFPRNTLSLVLRYGLSLGILKTSLQKYVDIHLLPRFLSYAARWEVFLRNTLSFVFCPMLPVWKYSLGILRLSSFVPCQRFFDFFSLTYVEDFSTFAKIFMTLVFRDALRHFCCPWEVFPRNTLAWGSCPMSCVLRRE